MAAVARGLIRAVTALGIAAGVAACDADARDDLVHFDQGWTQEVRTKFYHYPQGSRFMPRPWFVALERLDGQGRFADPDNLARYGLLPSPADSAWNPDALPVGFALETADTRPGLGLTPDLARQTEGLQQVGMTCAACHTATVTVHGKPLRIDGAPAHFDFDSFYADLNRAVTATLLDDARFARFAGRVLGAEAGERGAQLKQAFARFQVALAGDAALRRPELESGYGRVDALTQIVNSLSVRDQKVPANIRPVAAPTSYPPLWLTPRLEFVQWNPVAASPIGRNGGQVLGVFGAADLTGASGQPFSSTIRFQRLHTMEGWIAELEPPQWAPELMGSIDGELAAKGEQLFADNCAGCHNMAPYEMTDPADNAFGQSFIKIGKIDYKKVGTDPAYVESLSQRLVETNQATARLMDGKPVVPAAEFFMTTVGAVIQTGMQDAGLSQEQQVAFNGFRFTRDDQGNLQPYTPKSITKLKASPLTGVWATGPYLHNGSVPTVYELLSPPDERRDVFWTGGRELDLERLGFVSTNAPGRFRYDTSLPGNGNGGHAFPRDGLSHAQRMAVIEYLKTQ
jgi:mono/diheme cytochrome c family protein